MIAVNSAYPSSGDTLLNVAERRLVLGMIGGAGEVFPSGGSLYDGRTGADWQSHPAEIGYRRGAPPEDEPMGGGPPEPRPFGALEPRTGGGTAAGLPDEELEREGDFYNGDVVIVWVSQDYPVVPPDGTGPPYERRPESGGTPGTSPPVPAAPVAPPAGGGAPGRAADPEPIASIVAGIFGFSLGATGSVIALATPAVGDGPIRLDRSQFESLIISSNIVGAEDPISTTKMAMMFENIVLYLRGMEPYPLSAMQFPTPGRASQTPARAGTKIPGFAHPDGVKGSEVKIIGGTNNLPAMMLQALTTMEYKDSYFVDAKLVSAKSTISLKYSDWEAFGYLEYLGLQSPAALFPESRRKNWRPARW
ncbi:MAG: hypothetical protein U0835_05365 [Isosphaeraceae bacterium]